MSSVEIVGWFADIGLEDRPHVGGKGGSLGELQRAGIEVPPGFVVKTSAFERFIRALEREAPIRARIESLDVDDLAAATACCGKLRERVESSALPEDVLAEITTAHTALCGGGHVPVAVRSSATTEDASDASFAGLQDTFLWVTTLAETLKKVRACWASLYSLESVTYRRRRGVPEEGVAMAVVVQQMVDARTAGVMFTRSPLTGDRSVITVEGAWGLGSAVVGGEVTPDRWVMGKVTGEITVREISEKLIRHSPSPGGGTEVVTLSEEQRRAACLTDEELQALRAIGRKVERHYGCAQDIEWAVAAGTSQILLLQSRPETVWSRKETAPVARPASDPLSHVMSIFGGQR
ncbi:MAG TPA: PEP/pyruvate-binding domain-containing protein [Steroidobacteraceae bacterium]|nr:PEP/pyruvate-binding domain-containing protein [Steroidobacteraceae bacterium]